MSIIKLMEGIYLRMGFGLLEGVGVVLFFCDLHFKATQVILLCSQG